MQVPTIHASCTMSKGDGIIFHASASGRIKEVSGFRKQKKDNTTKKKKREEAEGFGDMTAHAVSKHASHGKLRRILEEPRDFSIFDQIRRKG